MTADPYRFKLELGSQSIYEFNFEPDLQSTLSRRDGVRVREGVGEGAS